MVIAPTTMNADMVNCETINPLRKYTENLLVPLALTPDFNACTGSKDDNIVAGYKPDRNPNANQDTNKIIINWVSRNNPSSSCFPVKELNLGIKMMTITSANANASKVKP